MLSFHVLGVPWSHPQADHSFQTCLVIKQVTQCFYFQAGRGVFAGYCTGIAFINQAITKNSQIHRTNNYRGFHIQNSATSSGCKTLSHKFHSITSAGHPAYSRTASRSRLALVINIFLWRTLQRVMQW